MGSHTRWPDMSMFKNTGVQLDIITQPAIKVMIVRRMRVGVCIISKRQATPNNPRVGEFSPAKQLCFILDGKIGKEERERINGSRWNDNENVGYIF